MSIKILKLITNEELVADIVVRGSSVTLSKPFLLTMAKNPENPSGELQLALFPYVPYVKDHTIDVDISNIIWEAELPEGMIKDYLNALKMLSITDVSPKPPSTNFTNPVNIT
jgi:hypothetical protein